MPVLSDEEYNEVVQEARTRVERMDRIGKSFGDPRPCDCPLDVYLGVVLSACECGIKTGSMETVADAVVMLEQGLKRARNGYDVQKRLKEKAERDGADRTTQGGLLVVFPRRQKAEGSE